MDNSILWTLVQLAILVVSALIGKYIIPKISQKDVALFNTILKWVDAFVISAKNLMSDKSGEEKKAAVTEQIRGILEKYNVTLTDEQISALIEKAYDTIVANVPASTDTKS